MWRRPLAVATAASACAALARASTAAPDTLARARVTEKSDVASTRFIKLQTLTYLDPTGRARKWDMATRTTKRGSGEPDAVAILALLRTSQSADVEMLLVQQFRPPVDAPTIELPAGLIDPGETPENAALRELKEETGYVGTIAHTSPVLAMSPGMCDETIRLCVVDVDLDTPANRAPAQQLEESEFIRVHRVPLGRLLTTLKQMERDGLLPFGGLYTLATGLAIGQAAASGTGRSYVGGL